MYFIQKNEVENIQGQIRNSDSYFFRFYERGHVWNA